VCFGDADTASDVGTLARFGPWLLGMLQGLLVPFRCMLVMCRLTSNGCRLAHACNDCRHLPISCVCAPPDPFSCVLPFVMAYDDLVHQQDVDNIRSMSVLHDPAVSWHSEQGSYCSHHQLQDVYA
jgi:hypothetical protein